MRPRPASIYSFRMHDAEKMDVARWAIRRFGSEAERVMRERAANHAEAGEEEGAEFWLQVANVVRCIQTRARLMITPASRTCVDNPNRHMPDLRIPPSL